jgi:hypothetical protein
MVRRLFPLAGDGTDLRHDLLPAVAHIGERQFVSVF